MWAELWTFMGFGGILLCLLNHVGLIRVLTSLEPSSPAILRSAILPGWAKTPDIYLVLICFETKIIASLNERRINGIYPFNPTAKLPEQLLLWTLMDFAPSSCIL